MTVRRHRSNPPHAAKRPVWAMYVNAGIRTARSAAGPRRRPAALHCAIARADDGRSVLAGSTSKFTNACRFAPHASGRRAGIYGHRNHKTSTANLAWFMQPLKVKATEKRAKTPEQAPRWQHGSAPGAEKSRGGRPGGWMRGWGMVEHDCEQVLCSSSKTVYQ